MLFFPCHSAQVIKSAYANRCSGDKALIEVLRTCCLMGLGVRVLGRIEAGKTVICHIAQLCACEIRDLC